MSVRVVRLTAEHLALGFPAALLEAGQVVHADGDHPSFTALRRHHPALVASEVIPDGAVLLVPQAEATPFEALVYVVDRLLGPGGCPWDQAQTHESLKKHLLSETYEVIDAIDSGDLEELREELGDLLLQPLMHSQMEKLAGRWSIDDVARAITEKLVRRHPHVFGDTQAKDADEVLKNWDAIKAAEKGGAKRSTLGGIPRSTPSLLRAFEISVRAARSGFEWPNLAAVFEKLAEEQGELHAAIESGHSEAVASELGDLLFTVVNVARWLKVEPEDALRKMVDRFTARFERMEQLAKVPLDELDAPTWDALWNQAKRELAPER